MKLTGSQPALPEGDRYDGAPKTQLYCPVCGHESPADGDWVDVRTDGEDDERMLVTCPDCGLTITERPGPSRAIAP